MADLVPDTIAAARRGRLSNVLPTWWCAGLFIMAAISSCATALTRPFWNDEICSAAVANLRSFQRILEALRSGADGQPPLFHLITSLFAASSSNQEFWMRVPAILGFLVLIATLFVFMKRARGPVAALVSVSVLVSSEGFYFASEARPYGAMLGCLGIAILLWQRRKRGNHSVANLVGLFLALTAVCALHYFGLFSVVIFGLVESALAIRSRRPDWALFLALPLTLAPVIWAKPLIDATRGHFSGAFWARPSWKSIVDAYQFTFSITTMNFWAPFHLPSREIYIGNILPAFFLVTVLGILLLRVPRQQLLQKLLTVPPESFLTIGFLLLPLITGIAGMVAIGAFVPRYAIAGIIGAAAVLGWVSVSLGKKTAYTVAAVLTVFFVSQQVLGDAVGRMAAFSKGATPSATMQKNLDAIFQRTRTGSVVVIPEGHLFVEAAYYAPPEMRPRVMFLQDFKLAVRFSGNDSAEVSIVGLKPYLDLHVEDLTKFINQQREFFMASNGGPGGWLPIYLKSLDCKIEPVEKDAFVTVEMVRLPVL